jgi:hypothetical protein
MNPLLVGRWKHQRTFSDYSKHISIPYGVYKIHSTGLVEYAHKHRDKWIKSPIPFKLQEIAGCLYIIDEQLNEKDSIVHSVNEKILILGSLLGHQIPKYFFEFQRVPDRAA